jgi:hypothetical protein
MAAPIVFARLVAGFDADVAPAAVDAVIDLARALGAELQAVLYEDVATLALAALPSPRAFDPRRSLWRDVLSTDLQRELELAAAMLRRRFESARGAGLRAEVVVAPGAPSHRVASAGDLLVVNEPADPMARWVQPFAGQLVAALAAPLAVLYLPHRGVRAGGPIAFFGADAAALAQRLAQALGAPCIDAQGERPGTALLPALLPALGERRARVLVCSRAALGPQPQRALLDAGAHRLAVLLTAPATP